MDIRYASRIYGYKVNLLKGVDNVLELPEVLSRVRELNENIVGKMVKSVIPPSSPHTLCWFNGEVESYNDILTGKKSNCCK